MATSTTPAKAKETDWADVSEDDDEEPTPTVKVDSIDLTSLSLKDKAESAGFPKQ
jgi:hypothetical protein